MQTIGTEAAVYATVFIVSVSVIWTVSPTFYDSLLSTSFSQLVVGTNDEVAQLHKKIGSLTASLQQMRNKNRQLQATAKDLTTVSTSTLPEEYVSAAVKVRPPTSPYDTILVSAGRTDNITRGAAVWWPPGILIGRIADVRKDSSVVELVSAPDSRHQIRINNRISATLIGRGGGDMVATVPSSTQIKNDTRVVSDRYNVPVGQIVQSRPAAAAGRTMLFIQPIIPVSVIEYVRVEV